MRTGGRVVAGARQVRRVVNAALPGGPHRHRGAASLSLPFGPGRRSRDARRGALLRGAEVVLEGRLRRTSARGWGPWTDVVLSLGSAPDGPVSWHADDPVAVGLPATRGPVDATFTDIDDVWPRPVRFRTEAFWGMDGEIVVVTAEGATTELALPGPVTAPFVERVREQLGLEPLA